jgi:ABC-type antimicrobial peptide transport system permease subunit
MRSQPVQPPQWPLRVLRLFLKKEYLEEIEGDMEEIFYDNAERLSPGKAKRIYTLEMLKLLRPALVRNLQFIKKINQLDMFQNYFKVSIRGLMKNPVNSFINIIGLSVSVGICVFGYAFARWTYSTDQFHEHKQEVFMITYTATRDGQEQLFGRSPRPVGEMLKEDFPLIRKMCRVEDRSVIVKQNEDVFHQRIRYTDPEFLEMFTFPMKWGTASSLKDVNSIILSENMSKKYFGEDNPVGQSMRVIFSEDASKEFKVAGVAKEFPKSLTIRFDFLINFENFRTSEADYKFDDWNAFVNATFVQVDNPGDVEILKAGMEKYRAIQNKAVNEDWAITSFGFEPLATLHERSEYIRDDISRSSKDNYLTVMFLVVLSVFLLALACFNYINIAIVTATRRIKEIGVRKCIGASRKVVTVQFLTENIVLTFFALIVGIVLAMTFFIPGFERLWSFDMGFSFADPNLWIYLPLLLLFTSIASGIYPSLYISKFQVVNILKGSVVFGRKNWLTKTLLGFQLVIACIFITTSIMFAQNNYYMSHRPWGYNQNEALYAQVPDGAAYEKLHALMAAYPDVVSISGSKDHVGRSNSRTVLHFPGRDHEVDQLSVDAGYFSTLGIPVKEGRVFKEQAGSDRHAVLVNEFLVNEMKWETAIGQLFRIDTIQYEVIGVVKDFHNYNFFNQVKPLIFTRAEEKDFRYLTLKVTAGTELEVYRILQNNWAKLYPEIPFEGNLQEDVWGFYYEQIGIYSLVWRVFAIIAITLCSLGLYGMVRLNIEGRTKEFSIRKVLGAGLKSLTINVTNQYTALFVMASCTGLPLGYLFAKWIIGGDPYHMPITFSGVGLAAITLVFILIATITSQLGKLIKANPVDGLKSE